MPHPKAGRVKVQIPFGMKEERERFKQLNGTFYHQQQKLWSIVNTPDNLEKIRTIFGKKLTCEPFTTKPAMPEIMLDEQAENELERHMKKMILKDYGQNTIKLYMSELRLFFSYFKETRIQALSKEQIEGFLYVMVSKYKISERKQNSLINAIKNYYELTLEKPREYYNLARPRSSKDLPDTLSKEEIAKIINSPENLKHRAILTTIYSAGLRIGEVCRLRVRDIHSAEGYLFIKDSKGKKDRHAVLSDRLLALLREYYRAYKPSYWLFEGQSGDKYTTKSIQQIFRKAVLKTGSNPWATVHTMRHSYATHLLEAGVNLRYIQTSMGHSSSKTTEIYTRVISINKKTLQSPLDLL